MYVTYFSPVAEERVIPYSGDISRKFLRMIFNGHGARLHLIQASCHAETSSRCQDACKITFRVREWSFTRRSKKNQRPRRKDHSGDPTSLSETPTQPVHYRYIRPVQVMFRTLTASSPMSGALAIIVHFSSTSLLSLLNARLVTRTRGVAAVNALRTRSDECKTP